MKYVSTDLLTPFYYRGVVLFAMVNGKLPFNDTSVKNLLLAINKGITFQSNVSEACRDIISSMLVADTGKRNKISEILKHPWFDPDITSPYRSCGTPSPREGDVARADEKQFIETPRPSPMATPRSTPRSPSPRSSHASGDCSTASTRGNSTDQPSEGEGSSRRTSEECGSSNSSGERSVSL